MLNSKNVVSLHRFSKEEYFSKKFGEVVEWSITAVLKTAERRRSGGSNPSLSAKKSNQIMVALFFVFRVKMIDFFCFFVIFAIVFYFE